MLETRHSLRLFLSLSLHSENKLAVMAEQVSVKKEKTKKKNQENKTKNGHNLAWPKTHSLRSIYNIGLFNHSSIIKDI